MAVASQKRSRKIARPDGAPVLSFSPVGIIACYDKLFSYAYTRAHLDRVDRGEYDKLPDDDLHVLKVATRELPEGTLVAAAGDGSPLSIKKLQRILDKAQCGLVLPTDLPEESKIGVSSVKYEFEWPGDMMLPENSRRTDGAFVLEGHYHWCFLGRVFAKRGSYDTLGVYVERNKKYEITVTMVGMPDKLPSELVDLANVDAARVALLAVYKKHVLGAKPAKDAPALGRATMFNADGRTTYALDDWRGKRLPGGGSVNYAAHVCRLFMNKDGGGVHAGTIMISKGISFDKKPPVDIDFRTFANGYLVVIELVPTKACEPGDAVPLVIGWVNPPKDVRAMMAHPK